MAYVDPHQLADLVNARSHAVLVMQHEWPMIEALLGGTRTMRAATQYMPQFAGESQTTYGQRVNVSTLFPAFQRTLTVMSGKPFAKPITYDDQVPEEIKTWCENVDGENRNLTSYAATLMREALAYGLCGTLVDYNAYIAPPALLRPDSRPPVQVNEAGVQFTTSVQTVPGNLPTPNRSIADEKRAGVRPYFTFVRHDQILGWRTNVVDGRIVFTQLRILETVEQDIGRYGVQMIQQIRVLYPDHWELHRAVDANGIAISTGGIESFIKVAEGANTLGEIPFVPFYGRRLGFMNGQSPLNELAYLNTKHWQSQSDQDNIMHFARVPIFCITGMEKGPNDPPFVVGATANILPVGGDMKFVEHTGQSVKAGQESLDALEKQMLESGAELLVQRHAGAGNGGGRTATEANNDAQANKSDLQRIVELFSDSIDQCLQLVAKWMKLPEGGHCKIYDEFLTFSSLDVASAQLIVQMRMQGMLPTDTALREMQRRGILNGDLNIDDEISKAQQEGPPMGSLLSVTAGGNITPPPPNGAPPGPTNPPKGPPPAKP